MRYTVGCGVGLFPTPPVSPQSDKPNPRKETPCFWKIFISMMMGVGWDYFPATVAGMFFFAPIRRAIRVTRIAHIAHVPIAGAHVIEHMHMIGQVIWLSWMDTTRTIISTCILLHCRVASDTILELLTTYAAALAKKRIDNGRKTVLLSSILFAKCST